MSTNELPRFGGRLQRVALVLLALSTCGLAISQHRELVAARKRLAAILEDTGVAVRRPQASADLAREPDPIQARLVVARALLADVLDPSPRDIAPTARTEQRLVSLRLARDLATEALEERPASPQGLMILGGATYLERSIDRRDELLTRYRDWELPLERARAIAPNEPDPQRFLSLAYLEIWPMLSEAKQQLTREMLGVAFRDPQNAEAFVDAWLRAAGDGPAAFDILPLDPRVWARAQAVLIASQRWPRAAAANARLLEALDLSFRTSFEVVDARIRGGDIRRGRDGLIGLAIAVPPDTRWLGLFSSFLERLPPGPMASGPASLLTAWLRWNLDRCLMAHCLLPPHIHQRLLGLADGLDPVTEARSWLAADQLVQAEKREPRLADPNLDSSLYWLQKVPQMIARGDLKKARAALTRIRQNERSTVVFAVRSLELAEAEAAAAGRAERPNQRGGFTRSALEWKPEEWTQSGGQFRLTLWPARPAATLVLEFGPSPRGGVVEVRWDGGTLGAFALTPSTSRLVLAVDAGEQLHVLEIRALGGALSPPAVSVGA